MVDFLIILLQMIHHLLIEIKYLRQSSCYCCQIWHIRAKFGFPNSPQFPDIGQNSDGGMSDLRISGQSLIKVNCLNSRTSGDIEVKLGPVTKLYKRSDTKSKKIDDDVMSTNCDVIVIFQIYGQFGAIGELDSGRIVFKTYIFINSNFLSYKN